MVERFEHFSLSIFNISRYWNKLTTEEMKKYGLRGSYALYLVIMASHEGKLTAANLSELVERDKADISRAIAAMEEKGLLRRVGDSYRACLELTAEGMEVAKSLNERATIAIDLASQGVSDEHREIMYHSLDQITENLRAMSKSGLPESKQMPPVKGDIPQA